MVSALGVTGRSRAMPDEQAFALARLLIEAPEYELHHGDCVGADAAAHAVWRMLGRRVVVHPPDGEKNRAWCEGDEAREPAPPLVRDEAIARESARLIACPEGAERSYPRSGTWATVRRARRLGRPVTIVWPDGSVEVEPPPVKAPL
jgi:hypothetical protein